MTRGATPVCFGSSGVLDDAALVLWLMGTIRSRVYRVLSAASLSAPVMS